MRVTRIRIYTSPTHHAVDAELVPGELGDERPLLDVPDADGGEVAALARHQVAPVVREPQARDRLARRVGDVRLTVLPRVVQHHSAPEKIEREGDLKCEVNTIALSCSLRKSGYKI